MRYKTHIYWDPNKFQPIIKNIKKNILESILVTLINGEYITKLGE